jgi:hypothetical protein
MITATRRTVTEHRAECKTREELLEALNLAPADARIWIHVPGGGDYSNCVLNLFDDLPVCLSWKTEETVTEPETVEVGRSARASTSSKENQGASVIREECSARPESSPSARSTLGTPTSFASEPRADPPIGWRSSIAIRSPIPSRHR